MTSTGYCRMQSINCRAASSICYSLSRYADDFSSINYLSVCYVRALISVEPKHLGLEIFAGCQLRTGGSSQAPCFSPYPFSSIT